jgi:hypothetical protein
MMNWEGVQWKDCGLFRVTIPVEGRNKENYEESADQTSINTNTNYAQPFWLGLNANACVLYLGSPRFASQTIYQLSWLFVIFLSPSR